MSATNLLLARVGSRAEVCPHPAAREVSAIAITASRRPFIACQACYRLFGDLIAAWHRREIGPAEVARRLSARGYGRLDQARFVLQLVADRLRVRLGFASQEAFDV